MNTLAQRFADRISEAGVEVTQVTGHSDSTTVQFSIIPNPIEEIYYKSVVEFSKEGYVKRYEIRLPHKRADTWNEKDVETHFRELLEIAETENISDWGVNLGETDEIIAAHIESFYGKEDAPSADELSKYVKNLHSIFNKSRR